MKLKTIKTSVYKEESTFNVIQYDHTDIPDLKNAYDGWRTQKHTAKKLHGRSPNIPEYITEACLCLVGNYVRFYNTKGMGNRSFDCFDILREKTIQVKACSVVKDLTSFGPKTKWDKFYFLDFYNDVIDENKVYQWRHKYVRENKKNVCPTLTANMGTGGHNVPIIKDSIGIRKLTPLECLRLQGFPDSYVLPDVSDCVLYKQIGNSVSVPVIEKIAKNIVTVL